MPDLETLLRDVRPTPRPQWTERMDAKAAAGFPSRPPAHRRALGRLRSHFAGFALATASLATVLLIVIVAVKVQHGSSDSSGGSTASDTSAAALPAMKKAAPEASSGASAAVPEALSGDRAVLKNATLTLTAAPGEVQALSDRAIRVADTLGGYVASSSVDSTGTRATATLTLKVPSARLDTALAQLSKLGHVGSRSQQSEDLTDQRSVLQGAVRDARADRDGLRSRLAKATTDKQRDRLRAQLNTAGRRVTRAEREVAQLGRTVAYATIDLTIRGRRTGGAATGGADAGDRWTPGDALRDAGRVLEVVAGVAVIALAVLLPLAILVALATYANRGLTRRRRERTLEAS